ncbi:hypothetical protein BurJ1DRAFT_1821 [Burkholderiales bacterium JOSHI_001]|nr:hypothetical protein BurJ1DRAFT_1821 [Burkholderiales bacterium JOSHI_001]
MSNLITVLTKNPKHWANNFAGIFLIAVMMFVIVIAVGQQYPRSGTSTVLWLLGMLGVGSLGAWGWLAYLAGGKNAQSAMFKA